MPDPILLPARGVVEVSGPDAEKFLHNILTNSVAGLAPGAARYAALLAPQGKILFDFLAFVVIENDERRFLLDCPAALAGDLVKRLGMYKLRAAIAVADRSGDYDALAVLCDAPPQIAAIALARDPRATALGWRALAVKGAVPAPGPLAGYEAARVTAGVPLGGVDFLYADAFPHEANMDRLGGVDFKKGCYVGQEVVSRMQHRNLTKKRVTPFHFAGPVPAPGAPIMAGEKEVGTVGSISGAAGLAMARLDRIEDAKAAGIALTVGDAVLAF